MEDFVEVDITTERFMLKCEKAFDLKAKADALRKEATEIEKDLANLEREIVGELDKLGVNSFESQSGKLIKTVRTSVKVPQGDDKLAFLEFLKTQGIMEALVTVNSNTLNSWYRERLEEALQKKEMLVIPGLAMPTSSSSISFRKK